MTRPTSLATTLAVLLVVLGAAAPLRGQAAEPAAPPPSSAAAAGPDIDQILEGDEEVLEGSGYTYDPGTRRDPFKSLLAAQDRPLLRGPRPDGIAGLMIDEVDLTGIFKTPRGFIAQVQASNKEKSFLLREGDQLYDGEVIRIARSEVVFKQIVNDPTALKPFREVVKKLSP